MNQVHVAQLWLCLLVPNFVARLKRQKIQFGPESTLNWGSRWNWNYSGQKPFQDLSFKNVRNHIIFKKWLDPWRISGIKRFNIISSVDVQYVNRGSSFMESSMLWIDWPCKERANGSILICFWYWLFFHLALYLMIHWLPIHLINLATRVGNSSSVRNQKYVKIMQL